MHTDEAASAEAAPAEEGATAMETQAEVKTKCLILITKRNLTYYLQSFEHLSRSFREMLQQQQLL